MALSAKEGGGALQRVVDAEVEAFRAPLEARLGAAFDALAERISLAPLDGQGYFFRPFALPVLHLPGWVATAAERSGSVTDGSSLEALRRSAVAGYLHVRVQDDFLDEGQGPAGESMLLAEALFARHQALSARVVGRDERYWALFERCWREYGESMLLEAELLRGDEPYDRARFDAVLRRSRPLLLPAAGILSSCGRWQWLPDLEAFVRHLACGHQLFHDLIHVEKDLRQGARTYVARRLSAEEGIEALRRRTFLEGGFDEIVAEAASELEAASGAAHRLGMEEAVRAISDRQRQMEEVQRQTFGALFGRILATVSPRS